MAKLTNDITRVFETQPDANTVLVAAGAKIYAGALVGRNADGYGRPFEAGDAIAGFAKDHIDNTSGADGDKSCDLKAIGKVALTIPGVKQSDIGKMVYAIDEDGFTLTTKEDSALGRVIRIEAEDAAIVAFDLLNADEELLVVDAEEEPNEGQGE